MLNKTFLEEIKIRLEKEADQLQSQLESFAKKDKQVPGDWDAKFPEFKSANLEEKADEVEEYENLLQIEGALETRLVEVKEALVKMSRSLSASGSEEGNYGRCENCQKEISQDRLSAIPEAKLCNGCQKIRKT